MINNIKVNLPNSYIHTKDKYEDESTIFDYISLLKPRVMSLVIFTAISGLILAPSTIHPVTGFASILFTSLGAGAAGAFNMWYEKDIDALMDRTKNRALVRGVIEETDAIGFAVILSCISLVGMVVCVNIISSALLLLSIIFYVIIYTIWLKPISAQNIVIGGAAGAFPPMIGWSSSTGQIDLDSIILFGIIFLWTPPHFWALSLYKSEDYKKASIPMMPLVKGVRATKNQIFAYAILMSMVAIAPFMTGLCKLPYLIVSCFMNFYFIFLAYKLKQEDGIRNAPKLFGFSILYLFIIFGSMMIEKLYYL
ncbi:MAG: protoheme IX farnesyltransferase [Alphaproteobacteria bacterium]|nr:protoheme IX farnesyltransferase [Alphaproteobacteria bacterium]